MTPKEILQAARDLLSDPDKWTKGEFAYDGSGNSVEPEDKAATCFCSAGAILHVAEHNNVDWGRPLGLLSNTINGSITVFNDAPERTHAEVLDAFDRAIAAA